MFKYMPRFGVALTSRYTVASPFHYKKHTGSAVVTYTYDFNLRRHSQGYYMPRQVYSILHDLYVNQGQQ